MSNVLKVLNNKKWVGYVFILPWVIGFVVFTAIPFLYSLYLSFCQVRITADGIEAEFIKFENYQYAFTSDPEFIKNLVDFTKSAVVAVPLIVILALVIALLLNQKIRFRWLFRTIFFLPVIICSGPVIFKLQEQGVTEIPGLEEFILYQIAANSDRFLGDMFIFLMDNIILLLWFTGVQILIFIAALQKVDPQIYEAAKIDGASSWEIFWKVTLPTLYPMILVTVVYTTVMFSTSALNPVIATIEKNMFAVETGFGYASALSWTYFVVITIVLLVLSGMVILMQRKNE